MAICPVCKTECGDDTVCSVCGFDDVNRVFINHEEAIEWERTVLLPFKESYLCQTNIDDVLKINGNRVVKYYKRSKVEKVIIPNGITSIAPKAFWGCKEIKEIYLPDSITELPDNVFAFCSSLEKIQLSRNLKEIPKEIFEHCKSLKELFIPKSVTYIAGNAFCRCKNLRKVIVEEDNPQYKSVDNCLISKDGTLLFSGDGVLPEDGSIKHIYGEVFPTLDTVSIKIPEGVISIECCWLAHPFMNCEKLEEIILPKSLECIGFGAFSWCKSLKEIVLPENVSKIDIESFSHCDSLRRIDVAKENKKLYSKNNCVINRETKEIVLAIKTSIIPNDGSIEGIEYHAFERIIRTEPLVIPKSIVNIAENAFYDSQFDIYCEVLLKPINWNNNWCKWHKGNIYWGNEWHYEEGKPDRKSTRLNSSHA